MTKADLINMFKNHINMGRKNHVAYAGAALVEVFIDSHIVNNTFIMKCFILVCSIETLSMGKINTGVHRVRKFRILLANF